MDYAEKRLQERDKELSELEKKGYTQEFIDAANLRYQHVLDVFKLARDTGRPAPISEDWWSEVAKQQFSAQVTSVKNNIETARAKGDQQGVNFFRADLTELIHEKVEHDKWVEMNRQADILEAQRFENQVVIAPVIREKIDEVKHTKEMILGAYEYSGKPLSREARGLSVIIDEFAARAQGAADTGNLKNYLAVKPQLDQALSDFFDLYAKPKSTK